MISVVQLGMVSYTEGLHLQQKLVGLRKSGQIGDVLLLLEHSPVITLGRNAKAANILASTEALAARGVEVFECDRGGDVTFHGAGQFVGYPIFDLRGFSRQPAAVSHQEDSSQFSVLSSQSEPTKPAADVPWTGRKTLGAVDFVRRLEEVLIRTCGDFGIPTKRVSGLTGVWTDTAQPAQNREGHDFSREQNREGHDFSRAEIRREDSAALAAEGNAEAKIAAIGVHISRSVTSHGFALNVNTDLSYFNLIIPCGITAKPVTSMQKELARPVDLTEVAHAISRNFGSVFERQMLWVDTIDALLGNTVGVPLKKPTLHPVEVPFSV